MCLLQMELAGMNAGESVDLFLQSSSCDAYAKEADEFRPFCLPSEQALDSEFGNCEHRLDEEDPFAEFADCGHFSISVSAPAFDYDPRNTPSEVESLHASSAPSPAASSASSAECSRGRQSASSSRFTPDLLRCFLNQAESDGVVRLHREIEHLEDTSLGILEWEVLDVARWHEDVRAWFEEVNGSWSENSFNMRLRRLGFRPLNRAPRPATSGYDFGLRRTDVARHGFAFLRDKWQKYTSKSTSIPSGRRSRNLR